ncbi:unnamed protein product [Prorocentrum cordatum]|uniref:Uncharacterized protein n=1 Tax=Prorocentrum cordatum TaxID=2364126 RepID=A0ABN9TK21_9DINO|nr:unnamed protein product [Polarella glacialis]
MSNTDVLKYWKLGRINMNPKANPWARQFFKDLQDLAEDEEMLGEPMDVGTPQATGRRAREEGIDVEAAEGPRLKGGRVSRPQRRQRRRNKEQPKAVQMADGGMKTMMLVMLKQLIINAKQLREIRGQLYDTYLVEAKAKPVVSMQQGGAAYAAAVKEKGKGHNLGPPAATVFVYLLKALMELEGKIKIVLATPVAEVRKLLRQCMEQIGATTTVGQAPAGYLEEELGAYVDMIGSGSKRLADCKICKTVNRFQPTLYARERSDGCGARLQEVILWAAIAAKNGMTFGGLISKGICSESHGADIFVAATALLGLSAPEDLFVDDPPEFELQYKGLNDFHRRFREGDVRKEDYDLYPGANVVVWERCLACALNDDKYDLSSFLTPQFMLLLRGSTTLLSRQPAWVSTARLEERPVVALHLRRGDVTPGDDLVNLSRSGVQQSRLTPDSWYFGVVEHIRSVLPHAEVHVFSSTEDTYDPEEFNGYRRRGMHVHLDGDILDPWATMAQAQVLVMAKSSFSHVPAILNTHCVVYQPYWHKPLANWIVALGEEDEAAAPPLEGAAGEAAAAHGGAAAPARPAFDAAALRACLAERGG